jgi:hypothetical protein
MQILAKKLYIIIAALFVGATMLMTGCNSSEPVDVTPLVDLTSTSEISPTPTPAPTLTLEPSATPTPELQLTVVPLSDETLQEEFQRVLPEDIKPNTEDALYQKMIEEREHTVIAAYHLSEIDGLRGPVRAEQRAAFWLRSKPNKIPVAYRFYFELVGLEDGDIPSETLLVFFEDPETPADPTPVVASPDDFTDVVVCETGAYVGMLVRKEKSETDIAPLTAVFDPSTLQWRDIVDVESALTVFEKRIAAANENSNGKRAFRLTFDDRTKAVYLTLFWRDKSVADIAHLTWQGSQSGWKVHFYHRPYTLEKLEFSTDNGRFAIESGNIVVFTAFHGQELWSVNGTGEIIATRHGLTPTIRLTFNEENNPSYGPFIEDGYISLDRGISNEGPNSNGTLVGTFSGVIAAEPEQISDDLAILPVFVKTKEGKVISVDLLFNSQIIPVSHDLREKGLWFSHKGVDRASVFELVPFLERGNQIVVGLFGEMDMSICPPERLGEDGCARLAEQNKKYGSVNEELIKAGGFSEENEGMIVGQFGNSIIAVDGTID